MAIQLHDTFRLNLRRRLRELTMTQRDLARAMKVSDAYVSQVLNGDHAPTLETVERIASVLHTSTLYLLTPVDLDLSPDPAAAGVDVVKQMS